MAVHVEEKAREHHLPFCVQGEVGNHLSPHLPGYKAAESFDTHCQGYIGTYEIVDEQATHFLHPKGITKIHVEAHPEHAWRVVMTYRRWGIEVVSLCVKDKPYPIRSTQTWCRNKWRFMPYEIVARLLYLVKGYI